MGKVILPQTVHTFKKPHNFVREQRNLLFHLDFHPRILAFYSPLLSLASSMGEGREEREGEQLDP